MCNLKNEMESLEKAIEELKEEEIFYKSKKEIYWVSFCKDSIQVKEQLLLDVKQCIANLVKVERESDRKIKEIEKHYQESRKAKAILEDQKNYQPLTFKRSI